MNDSKKVSVASNLKHPCPTEKKSTVESFLSFTKETLINPSIFKFPVDPGNPSRLDNDEKQFT